MQGSMLTDQELGSALRSCMALLGLSQKPILLSTSSSMENMVCQLCKDAPVLQDQDCMQQQG